MHPFRVRRRSPRVGRSACWLGGGNLAVWGGDSAVHGPRGRRQHLLGNRAVDEVHLNGDLPYASVDNGGDQSGRVVVSLRSGQVLASSDELPPYLLDDPGPAR